MKAPKKMPDGALNPFRVALMGVLALATFAFLAPPAVADFAGGLGHTCWVSPAGGVECWGLNDAGQLGDGTTIDRAYPAPVYGLGPDPIFAVGTGEAFSCALSVVGALYCWGDNAQGQLGDGTRISSLEPIAVLGLGGTVESFSPGREHVCAVLSGNTAKCWGDNTTGQLGNGNFVDRLLPTPVAGLGGLVDGLASGYDHTCAVTISSDAYCWGQNNLGQLGDGTFIQRVQPTGVVGLSPSGTRIGFVAQMAAGEFHTCSTTPTGTVFCWGDNLSGQVGNANLGTLHVFPAIVAGIGVAVSQIEAGEAFTCVVDTAGGGSLLGREHGRPAGRRHHDQSVFARPGQWLRLGRDPDRPGRSSRLRGHLYGSALLLGRFVLRATRQWLAHHGDPAHRGSRTRTGALLASGTDRPWSDPGWSGDSACSPPARRHSLERPASQSTKKTAPMTQGHRGG